jgi:lysophospholipase L1-like esterase
MITRRRTICLALLLIGTIALIWVSGVVFWLALGLVTAGLIGVLMPAQRDDTDVSRPGRSAAVALVVGSVFVGLALLESVLWVLERAAAEPLPRFDAEAGAVPLAPELPPEIKTRIERMQGALVMPPAWQKRDLAEVPGTDPFVWHGVTHPIDANGMRRQQPFPPRDPERFRIMVVGDSLTYGEGIDAFWTYSAQLERSLATESRVEVLNLGVRGHASEDVLGVIRRFVPELQPDLLVYGVCLNDFLESDARQPDPITLLPKKVSKVLTRRTRVGRLVGERFGALALALGLQPNFYADLLTDFDERHQRFGDDVAAMNAFVTQSGLPPMVALVLDQRPRLEGPGRQLAVAAEGKLRAAGIETLDSEAFYRRYDGRSFRVSRWEGHPNEEANAIWASELVDVIRQQPDLARFRKAADTGDRPR